MVWLSPTMPKRGARVDDEAAVDLAVMAGEKDVDRGGIAEGFHGLGRVVDLAVGEHDHRAKAFRRDIDKAGAERAEQHRAVDHAAARAGVDGADLDVRGTRRAASRARPWPPP